MIEQALHRQQKANLLRGRRIVRAVDATHVQIDGRQYVNFAANDYLGLSHRLNLSGRGGSGSSPLITGHCDVHANAEAALAKWKGTEAALLLPSGYQANHAAVQALAGAAHAADRRVRFLIDKLVHASIVDAVRGSGENFRVFAHNDLKKLRRLLHDADAGELQIVVTESIFSMDGDAADLAGLMTLKREKPFVLVLDEAHATGVYGAGGRGYADELGLSADVDVFIITLSKAMGLAGGAICGLREVCDAVVNFGRAYIYSTAIAPALAAACVDAIALMENEPARQARVRELARQVRSALTEKGWKIPAGDSPIIPVIVGGEQETMVLAERLMEKGILVPAVRPPTVPRQSSRLRITLCSEHSDREIEQLLEALHA